MKKFLKITFVFVLLAVFCYSGLKVYQISAAYARAEAQYAELTQYVVSPVSPPAQAEELPQVVQSAPSPESLPTQPEEASPEVLSPIQEETLWPQVDFEALAAINPDIVGWLTIDGIGVHYPVVQGADNDFYLSHQFDKQPSRAGCLFLDMENDAAFGDSNSIIYGHYTKDRSMFYELRGYKQQDFFDAHPTGWLVTPSAVYQLVFFSGYVSDVYGDAWTTAFSEEGYLEWLKTCTAKSCFTSGVVPEKNSRIVTLSTCSYEFENARFVLHAILAEQSVSVSGK